MTYNIQDMQLFVTPKAETMYKFKNWNNVTFEFPGIVKTILFFHCGCIKSNLPGEDRYEIVGRLYSTSNPKQNGENHVGKLYIYVTGYPDSTHFETVVEQLEWYADGSFDVISPDGSRHLYKPNS